MIIRNTEGSIICLHWQIWIRILYSVTGHLQGDMAILTCSSFLFQIGMGIAAFFTVSLGGLAIGLIFGVLTAIFTKYTKQVRGELVDVNFPVTPFVACNTV